MAKIAAVGMIVASNEAASQYDPGRPMIAS